MKPVRAKLGAGTPTLTAAEYRKLRQPKGRSWVRRSSPADRTRDGHVFASKAEASRYVLLKLKQALGEITGFVCQPMLPLAGVRYTADFLCWKGASVWLEDVKGTRSHPEVMRRFRRNQKQVKELYGLEVRLIEVKS